MLDAEAKKALELFESRSFIEKICGKDYLNLPIAIAKELEITTIEPSTVLIVKEKNHAEVLLTIDL